MQPAVSVSTAEVTIGTDLLSSIEKERLVREQVFLSALTNNGNALVSKTT